MFEIDTIKSNFQFQLFIKNIKKKSKKKKVKSENIVRERRVKIKYCELHRCNSLDPNPPLYMDATSFSLLWFMRSNTCQKLLTLWFHFSANSSTWSWSSLNIKQILYFKQLKKIIFNKTKSIISLQKKKNKKSYIIFLCSP